MSNRNNAQVNDVDNVGDVDKLCVDDTCTVRAWSEYFQKLEKENPDAIFSCKDTVMHTSYTEHQMWTCNDDGYLKELRKTVSDGSYFNVLFVENPAILKERYIVHTLNTQDKELSRNTETNLKKFLNSLKGMNTNVQLEKVRRNARFRQKLYFFPDTGMWYTHDDVTGMCGGKLYYNFDNLFSRDETGDFIWISKIPFSVMSRSILKDPVTELLNQYESVVDNERVNIDVSMVNR